MRRKVYEHAMRLPLHRVYELKSGGASSLLREDAGGVGELIFSMLYNPCQAVVQFLGGVVVLAWVDWRLLLGALLLVPGVYYSDLIWNRRIRPLFRDVRKERQDIDSQTTEVFGGMRVVRAFGRQKSESARFMGENHFMARLELHAWWLSRLIELLWEFLLPMASVGLLLYGGLQVIDGRLSLGDLMMFLVYLAMLLEPMAVLATSVTQFQNNLVGLRPRARPAGRASRNGGVPRNPSRSQAGSLRPDHAAKRRLRLSRNDPAGAARHQPRGRTGRDHRTGRTKRIGQDDALQPGRPILRPDYRHDRARRRRPPRDPGRKLSAPAGNRRARRLPLRRHGRREHRLRRPLGDTARVEQAARAANAAEFIERLGDGYDTVIGERGVRLSGGQRQRLAIARAVLADPRIFILDEATSNLDSESERLIQQSLEQLLLGRTSFVIAHRLSTIRHADRILVLDDGAIVEAGSHAELMAGSGLYRDMVELQRIEQGDGLG